MMCEDNWLLCICKFNWMEILNRTVGEGLEGGVGGVGENGFSHCWNSIGLR